MLQNQWPNKFVRNLYPEVRYIHQIFLQFLHIFRMTEDESVTNRTDFLIFRTNQSQLFFCFLTTKNSKHAAAFGNDIGSSQNKKQSFMLPFPLKNGFRCTIRCFMWAKYLIITFCIENLCRSAAETIRDFRT